MHGVRPGLQSHQLPSKGQFGQLCHVCQTKYAQDGFVNVIIVIIVPPHSTDLEA